MTGICMQIVTLTIVGAYLGVTNGMSTAQIESTPSLLNASRLSIVAMQSLGQSVGSLYLIFYLQNSFQPVYAVYVMEHLWLGTGYYTLVVRVQ